MSVQTSLLIMASLAPARHRRDVAWNRHGVKQKPRCPGCSRCPDWYSPPHGRIDIEQDKDMGVPVEDVDVIPDVTLLDFTEEWQSGSQVTVSDETSQPFYRDITVVRRSPSEINRLQINQ